MSLAAPEFLVIDSSLTLFDLETDYLVVSSAIRATTRAINEKKLPNLSPQLMFGIFHHGNEIFGEWEGFNTPPHQQNTQWQQLSE